MHFGVNLVTIRTGLWQQGQLHGGTQVGRAHAPWCYGWGLAPLGDIRAPLQRGEMCDARSGAKPHIWARSRLLEASPNLQITLLITAQKMLSPPLILAHCAASISPTPCQQHPQRQDGAHRGAGAAPVCAALWR